MNGFWNALVWLNENITLPGAQAAVVAGYSGAVLALIVLAVNLLFRRWLTASQMLLLWGLVLLRMALPIVPGSQVSVHNAVIWLASNRVAPVAVTTFEVPPHAYASQPATVDFPVVDNAPTELPAAITTEAATHALIDVWIPLVWLAGTMVVLGWTLWTHWRFTRRIARVDACGDERLLRLWHRVRADLGVRREIPMVVCDEVSQPAVMGVWRAKLLLPSHCGDLSDESLRLVMLHELMHVRCWDVAVNWLLVLVRAAQWWNPFFWLAGARYANLREQSRDAMVLRHLEASASQSRSYAELLLSLAGRGVERGWRVMLPASLLGFISGWLRKRGVANRLKAMSSATRTQRRWHRAVVVGSILVIGLMGLTDANEPKPNTEPVYSDSWKRTTDEAAKSFVMLSPNAVPPGDAAMNEPTGPWSELEYDVTQGAAIIMRQKRCDADELPKLLHWDLYFLADTGRATGPPTDEAVTAVEPRESSDPDAKETARKVDSEASSNRPHAELRRDGEQWVIHAAGPESMHQRIRQTAHAWNRSGLGQVTIETRIATTWENVMDAIDLESVRFKAGTVGSQAGYESDKEAAEALRVESDATAIAVSAVEHHIPVLIAVLSEDQTRQFIQSVQGNRESDIMFAPKVTLFNGQHARMFSSVRRPFVVGLNELSDGGLQPQIRFVHEGFELSLHPELIEGHKAIDLVAKLDLSDIKDVQVFSTRIHGKDVALQVPSVGHTRVQTTARLEDNQTLLLCVPPTYEQKHYAWVLLTPRVITEEPVVLLGTAGGGDAQ